MHCLNPLQALHALPLALALALSGATPGLARADTSPPLPLTMDLSQTQGRLTAQLPNERATSARVSYVLPQGHEVNAELLDQIKLGRRGGVVAVGSTLVLDERWIVAGSLALGRGGPNWANQRADLELSTKWLPGGPLVTRVAVYGARFDNRRSDVGVRLAAVAYLPNTWVLEGGATVNVSQPGRVVSTMPYASASVGRDGDQTFSLRAAHGTEAYQLLASGAQITNFISTTIGLNWRYWMDTEWGVSAQAERYTNPSYSRNTLGAGLFAQW